MVITQSFLLESFSLDATKTKFDRMSHRWCCIHAVFWPHRPLIFHSHHPCRQFTLVRVVNVVKRVDGMQGSRYLLELELKDLHGQLLRLSHYIYTLTRYSRHRGKDSGFRPMKPQRVLCNPVGFRWYPAATVHFIVPGRPTLDLVCYSLLC